MEPVPLFFTVVLACTVTSLLMAAAAYLVYRIHERRATEAPRAEAESAPPAAVPVTPRERAPVLTAPPVPAQMYTPPKEMPKAEAAPKPETPPETKTAEEAETTERPETATAAGTTETETVEAEAETNAETVETMGTTETEAVTETKEAETMREVEPKETGTPNGEERTAPLPEPFFREYMGPGKLVPIRISERTRDGNDDEFVWL